MAAGNSSDRNDRMRPRHRAVRLSELIGDQSAPLPVRRARADDPGEAAESGDLGGEIRPRSGKKAGNRGKSAESAGQKRRPSAYDAAMGILACGDNSEKMLREKLARKGYAPSETEDALAILREKRYVCDARVMERYAAALSSRKYYGAYRIRQEMLRRFDRASVDEYFEEAVREIDFAAQARVYVEKNAHKDREYLIRRLVYLGYDRAQIRAAIAAMDLNGADR